MPLTAEIRQAYSDFLGSYEWSDFFTITFRAPRRDMYAALRDCEDWAHRGGIARTFMACEPHTTGMLHVHGLAYVNWPGDSVSGLSYDAWHTAFRRFGRSKFERCRSHEDVTGYCSKYVTKSNSRYEYAFGGNWTRPGGT